MFVSRELPKLTVSALVSRPHETGGMNNSSISAAIHLYQPACTSKAIDYKRGTRIPPGSTRIYLQEAVAAMQCS